MWVSWIVALSIVVYMIFSTTGYRAPSFNSGAGWSLFWIAAALFLGSLLP
jgi:hypothetical protein